MIMRSAVLLFFAGLVPALSNGAELDVIRMGSGTITATVAQQNGVFEKYGIEIQKVPAPSSETMRAWLADGRVDVVDNGLDNAVASIISGVDFIIVTGSGLSQQELIAQPGFKSAKELRGKTVIVDATNTQNALILKKILLLNGLKPDLDYQLKPLSTRRLPHLQANKEYAAGMLSGTTAILAKRQGFVSLGSSSKDIEPILASGAFVRRQWARDHAGLLSRYIAAKIEAQRWILNPANKESMVQILMTRGEPPVSADIANEAYADLVKALTKDLVFNVPAFEAFLKLRAEVEGSWGGSPPPAAQFYDLSYYQNALDNIVGQFQR